MRFFPHRVAEIVARGTRGWGPQALLARLLVALALLAVASPTAQADCGDHVLVPPRPGASAGASMVQLDLSNAPSPAAPSPCSGPNCGRSDPLPAAPPLTSPPNPAEQWPMLTGRLDRDSASGSLDRLAGPVDSAPDPLRDGIFHPPR